MFESHHQLQKASKTSVFDAFLLQKRGKWCGAKCGAIADPHRDPHRLAVSGFAAYCQLMPHGYVVHFSGSAGREHPRIAGMFGVLLLQQLHGILRDRHLADGISGFRLA